MEDVSASLDERKASVTGKVDIGGDVKVVEATGKMDVPATFSEYITGVTGKVDIGDGCVKVAEATGKKDVSASFDEYIASVKGGLFSKPAAYHVTQRDSPWPSLLRLELLVPAPEPVPPVAAPVLPPSGGDSGGGLGLCPSPRGEDEFEEIETIPWELYLLEKAEEEKEKAKEKAQEKEGIDLWETYLQRKREKEDVEKEKEQLKEREKDQVKEKEKEIEKEKVIMQEKVKGKEKEKGKDKMSTRMVKVGNSWVTEADWIRSVDLGRRVRARLFPNKRKRWEFERQHKKIIKVGSGKEQFEGNESDAPENEIFFEGKVLAQVGEAPLSPESAKIHFLFRDHGRLGMVGFARAVTLRKWFERLHEGQGVGLRTDTSPLWEGKCWILLLQF